MRAILNQDKIVKLTLASDKGVEIGRLEKGVGLERQRFDGEKVVDLAELDIIFVRHLGGSHFDLHAVEVPGSQQVAMRYADRRRLTIDNGVIRVKTEDEYHAEQAATERQQVKNRLRANLKQRLGDRDDQLADLNKLVYVLAEYSCTGSNEAKAMLDEILPRLRSAYDLGAIGTKLVQNADIVKDELPAYYAGGK